MQVNVDITPEEINRAVADAVIKSAIGESLQKAIEGEVKKLSQSYHNPITAVVQEMILKILRETIDTEFRDRIREQVRQKIEEKFVDDLIGTLWQEWTDRVRKEW